MQNFSFLWPILSHSILCFGSLRLIIMLILPRTRRPFHASRADRHRHRLLLLHCRLRLDRPMPLLQHPQCPSSRPPPTLGELRPASGGLASAKPQAKCFTAWLAAPTLYTYRVLDRADPKDCIGRRRDPRLSTLAAQHLEHLGCLCDWLFGLVCLVQGWGFQAV